MSDDRLSPICFGAITLYSEDSDRCLACASFQECGPQAYLNAQEISQVLDMGGLLDKHRSAKKVAKHVATNAVEQVAQDTGKLVTQAPVERAIDPAATAAKRELASSILTPLLGSGSTTLLRAQLEAGKNPFTPAMKEQWVLCELLRRGATTRDAIERSVLAVSGDKARKKAVVSILLAAKIVTAGEGDAILLNPVSV